MMLLTIKGAFSSVQSLSCVWLFATPWTTAHQASLSITNSLSLLKSMSTESMMPSSHLILGRPLLLLPSISPSIRVFSRQSVLRIRWPKDWSFSFSIRPSPQVVAPCSPWVSSKASILQCSASFVVQFSHPYMTTGKTTALTRQTLVCKVTSLLLNMLSRLVITFLPRSKRLLISWLQSPSAVIELYYCFNSEDLGLHLFFLF